MKKVVGLVAFCFLFCVSATVKGDIAFVGFNADGTDGFSVMTTEDIASGTVYWLTDREWDSGASSFNTGEGLISISIDDDVAAGSILNILNIDDDPTVPSIVDGLGSTVSSTFGGDVTTGISSGGEGLYLFQDTTTLDGSTVDIEIASYTNADSSGDAFTSGVAVDVRNTALDEGDVAAYVGPLNTQTSLDDYIALIQDVGNWQLQGDGSGDQSGSYVPPAPAFVAIPEPASATIVLLGMLGTAVLRRKQS